MVKKIKILFFCGHKSPYGLAHLEPLLQSDFDVIAVVLATDKRWNIFREILLGKNYYSTSDFSIRKAKVLLKKIIPKEILNKLKDEKETISIKKIVNKYKIPIWYIDNVNCKEFIQKARNNNIDLIISAAYPQIFSKDLISIAPYGAVNFHPSLLPKFRGAHPHYWAIVKGETESGLSAHFMTEHIDDGEIIAQIKFPIKDYNYNQLYKKILFETPNIVNMVENYFLHNKSTSIPQDPLKGSYYRNDREIHHRIFWNIYTAMEIFNLIRGGNAFCFFRNQKLIVKECSITETNRNLTNNIVVENGIIVDLGKDYVAINVKLGVLNIKQVRYKNIKLSVSKFIVKYKPLVGERFD
jgi:methionyl-tRNA formyltransferase